MSVVTLFNFGGAGQKTETTSAPAQGSMALSGTPRLQPPSEPVERVREGPDVLCGDLFTDSSLKTRSVWRAPHSSTQLLVE